jgi:hypothetical protein
MVQTAAALVPAVPDSHGRSGRVLNWVERRSLLLLACIVVLAAAVRVYGFRGYAGFDDAEYARFAYRLAHERPYPGDYTGPAVFPLRIGIIAPTALSYRLLGVSEWSTALWPLILSFAGIALAYSCTRLFFGAGAGVVAAALLAFLDADVDIATRLLPDLPGAFFAAAAVTAIAWAWERAIAPPRLWLAGAAAGLALGVSWLCKETVAYLAPFCFLWLLMTVRRDRDRAIALWAGVAAGAASVLLAEAAIYYAAWGDPLFRIHEMERNYRQWTNGFFTEGSDFGWAQGTDYRRALIDRLFVSGPRQVLFAAPFYGLPGIGLVAAVLARARADRRFALPGLWLLSLVVMFNFGSSSTRAYVPLPLFHRYFYLEVFPAAVLAAGFLWCVAQSAAARSRGAGAWLERALALAALAVIAASAAPALYFGVAQRSTWWTAEVRALVHQVRPSTPIYADALTLRGFEFFQQYPGETRWIEFADLATPAEIPPGSVVIVNPHYLKWLEENAGMWVNWPAPAPTEPSGYRQHPFYRKPPAGWDLIWQNGPTRVYRVVDRAAGGPASLTVDRARFPSR